VSQVDPISGQRNRTHYTTPLQNQRERSHTIAPRM
jgi:hypothetical protein